MDHAYYAHDVQRWRRRGALRSERSPAGPDPPRHKRPFRTTRRTVRADRFTCGVIEAKQAAAIEARLAEFVGVPVGVLRDYLGGNIRAGRARRTGYRFIRGTHGR